MQTPDILFLCFTLGAFALLGGVLGWASWEESRTRRGKQDRT